MASFSKEPDVEAVASRQRSAGPNLHCPSLGADHVLPEKHNRLWNLAEQTVCYHLPSPRAVLFSRLKQTDQSSGPSLPSRMQEFGRTHQACDVNIVPAGVHHWIFFSIAIHLGLGAGVGKPGELLDRQSVHVGSQHDDRAPPVSKYANKAVASKRTDDLVESESLEMSSCQR